MTRSVVLVVVVAALLVGASLGVYLLVFPSTEAPHVSAPVEAHDAGHDAGLVPPVVGGEAPVVVSAELVEGSGRIEVRSGTGAWVEAKVGQRIAADDAVRTGRGGEATLRMGNGIEVRLSPRSEFTVRELGAQLSRIQLDEGHVAASVDAAGKRTLRVAARGTDATAESSAGSFGVVTDGNGTLAVATTTGSVKFTSAGKTVEVAAGTTSTVVDGSAPSAPTTIPASLFLKAAASGEARTNQTSTTVSGDAAPGALVRVGDRTVHTDARGRFSLKVPLRDGRNELAVEVVDAQGRNARQALPPIVVDREAPAIDAAVQWGNGK